MMKPTKSLGSSSSRPPPSSTPHTKVNVHKDRGGIPPRQPPANAAPSASRPPLKPTPINQEVAPNSDQAGPLKPTPIKQDVAQNSDQAGPLKPTPIKQDVAPNSDQAGDERIQVAIRMRPLNAKESDNRRIWKVLPELQSVAQTTTEGKVLPGLVVGRNYFTFDRAFGEDSTTKQIYVDVAQPIVRSTFTGLNGTIFAYGQTSSGKTFTMQGTGGLVHMAAADIFQHIQSHHRDRTFLVRASVLEIYNKEVRDLLTRKKKVLEIHEDPKRGVFVRSKEEIVTDMNHLLEVLRKGETSRTVESTDMNERSSRSHTIFRITVESRHKVADQFESQDDEEEGNHRGDRRGRMSTLNLVDLAGSESVRHTGATGDRQVEGGLINKSLLTLSRVIMALGTPNQAHVNFRDSELTRLLQPSLSGNARLAVICCATPSELYLEETRSTLQFASRAKLVMTHATVNEVRDDQPMILQLQQQLQDQKKTIDDQEKKIIKLRKPDDALSQGKQRASKRMDDLLHLARIISSAQGELDALTASRGRNDALETSEAVHRQTEMLALNRPELNRSKPRINMMRVMGSERPKSKNVEKVCEPYVAEGLIEKEKENSIHHAQTVGNPPRKIPPPCEGFGRKRSALKLKRQPK